MQKAWEIITYGDVRYIHQSKTEGGKGLGTRLQNHGTFSRTFPESILGTFSRSFPGSILGAFLKTRVYVPMIALRSKHRDTVVRTRNDPAYTNSLFLSHLAFHIRPHKVNFLFLVYRSLDSEATEYRLCKQSCPSVPRSHGDTSTMHFAICTPFSFHTHKAKDRVSID